MSTANDHRLGAAGVAGMQFFGAVSATVTHELRNALAVINENGGLLGDLTALSAKGRALDPERLAIISKRILGQVGAAEKVLVGMNRFAHSADSQEMSVDVREAAQNVVLLCRRLVANSGRVVEVLPGGPVATKTSPFFLRNLLWRCLEVSLAAPATSVPIQIAPERSSASALLRFRGATNWADVVAEGFPGEPERALCRLLVCSLDIDSANDELTIEIHDDRGTAITLPERTGADQGGRNA